MELQVSDEITERKLRRLFPNASESFIEANCNSSRNTGTSNLKQPMDRKEIRSEQRKEKVEAQYRLRHVDILYWCSHGKELDPSDNASYAACKPIADALVQLGFASNDKDFKTQAAQRDNKDQVNF